MSAGALTVAALFSFIGVAGLTLVVLLVLHDGFNIGPDVRQVLPDHIPMPAPMPRPAFALSPEQRPIRKHILKNANKPESVWFEEWHPAVPVDEESWDKNYLKRLKADHVVHVIYRETYPILGEMRHDSLFYLNGDQVAWIAGRLGAEDFDALVAKYYGKRP